jgi:hypothetical protein
VRKLPAAWLLYVKEASQGSRALALQPWLSALARNAGSVATVRDRTQSKQQGCAHVSARRQGKEDGCLTVHTNSRGSAAPTDTGYGGAASASDCKRYAAVTMAAVAAAP